MARSNAKGFWWEREMNDLCAATTALRAYEFQQVKADHRAKAVAERAAEKREIGGECHPWTLDNFREAIGHCADVDLIIALSTIRSAVNLQLNNPYSNQFALSELKIAVEKYWLDVAMVIADREI